jgi:hypothetical protein
MGKYVKSKIKVSRLDSAGSGQDQLRHLAITETKVCFAIKNVNIFNKLRKCYTVYSVHYVEGNNSLNTNKCLQLVSAPCRRRGNSVENM